MDEDALRSAVDEKLGEAVSYKSMRLQTDKRTGTQRKKNISHANPLFNSLFFILTGKSRGFAYLHFSEKSTAEEALTLLYVFHTCMYLPR